MVTDSSPVKDYYPVDFETDLNGKLQEWEAVVLIPFIDEVTAFTLERLQLRGCLVCEPSAAAKFFFNVENPGNETHLFSRNRTTFAAIRCILCALNTFHS